MNWASNNPGSQPRDALTLPPPDALTPEAEAQYQAALAAALSLVPLVGAADDPVVVTIAGYAYPGHDPAGEPNEVITITVAARPEDRPVPEPEPAPEETA